jgi:exopolysaccharide biosynthesis predicted pyruvyltransferase EpsI
VDEGKRHCHWLWGRDVRPRPSGHAPGHVRVHPQAQHDAQPPLTNALQETLDRIRAGLLPCGTRAALVNYPNHHNAGDPALYLGGLRSLARAGVRLTYRCHHRSYDRSALARELDHGTEVILISGGGTLGDRYPPQQTREQVLSDFPDVPTIQLPQSMWFDDEANLLRFARLVEAHRNLTLLWRDRASLDRAAGVFGGARSILCPDLVFGLGELSRPCDPTREVVWLKRDDGESAGGRRTPYRGIEPVDWFDWSPEAALGDGASIGLAYRSGNLIDRVIAGTAAWPELAGTIAPLMRRRLHFGMRVLSGGRVAVSDRLHGVLLAYLMGIPAIAVDTRNGKVSSFLETWLRDHSAVALAPTHESALDRALELAATRG